MKNPKQLLVHEPDKICINCHYRLIKSSWHPLARVGSAQKE